MSLAGSELGCEAEVSTEEIIPPGLRSSNPPVVCPPPLSRAGGELGCDVGASRMEIILPGPWSSRPPVVCPPLFSPAGSEWLKTAGNG